MINRIQSQEREIGKLKERLAEATEVSEKSASSSDREAALEKKLAEISEKYEDLVMESKVAADWETSLMQSAEAAKKEAEESRKKLDQVNADLTSVRAILDTVQAQKKLPNISTFKEGDAARRAVEILRPLLDERARHAKLRGAMEDMKRRSDTAIRSQDALGKRVEASEARIAELTTKLARSSEAHSLSQRSLAEEKVSLADTRRDRDTLRSKIVKLEATILELKKKASRQAEKNAKLADNAKKAATKARSTIENLEEQIKSEMEKTKLLTRKQSQEAQLKKTKALKRAIEERNSGKTPAPSHQSSLLVAFVSSAVTAIAMQIVFGRG
eukprot:g3445.t1